MSNYADVLRERAREAAEFEEAFLPAPLSELECRNRANRQLWMERRYRAEVATTLDSCQPSVWECLRREMLQLRSFFGRFGT